MVKAPSHSATHEAAHAVVAVLVGAKIIAANRHYVEWCPGGLSPIGQLAIGLAGPLLQSHRQGRDLWDCASESDARLIRAALAECGFCAWHVALRWVGAMLMAHRHTIERVALALDHSGSITGDAVTSLVSGSEARGRRYLGATNREYHKVAFRTLGEP